MSNEEIKDLIHLVQETGIAELEVQRGDNKVRIRRATGTATDLIAPVLPVALSSPAAVAQFHPALGDVSSPAEDSAIPAKTEPEDHNYLVKSPIVGTYYDSPAPGSPAFVKVGDHVSPKQVLCIIESMKLMNEIEAEVAGTLVAKYVENGKPVEYGEPLFSVRPQ